MQLTPHFTSEELQCKCGCGDDKIDMVALQMLERARMYAQMPFHINSGKRCIKHNAEVGGKEDSAHLDGYAFDVKCDNSSDKFIMIRCFLRAGFVRLGIYKTFIHVDADPTKPQEVAW